MAEKGPRKKHSGNLFGSTNKGLNKDSPKEGNLTDKIFQWAQRIALPILAAGFLYFIAQKFVFINPHRIEIQGVDSTIIHVYNRNGVCIKTYVEPEGIKYARLDEIGGKKCIIAITKYGKDDALGVGHPKPSLKIGTLRKIRVQPKVLKSRMSPQVEDCGIFEIKQVEIADFIPEEENKYKGNEICLLVGDPHWSTNCIAIYPGELEEETPCFQYYTFGATGPIRIGNFDDDKYAEILGFGCNNTLTYMYNYGRRGSRYLYCLFMLDPESMLGSQIGNVFQAPDSIYKDIPTCRENWYYVWAGKSICGTEGIVINYIDQDNILDVEFGTTEHLYIAVGGMKGKVKDVSLCDEFFEKTQYEYKKYKYDLFLVERRNDEIYCTPMGIPHLVEKALAKEKYWQTLYAKAYTGPDRIYASTGKDDSTIDSNETEERLDAFQEDSTKR